MTEPLILAIHGMGNHDEKDLEKNILEPLNNAAKHFSSIKKFSTADNFVPIIYDNLWNEIRTKLANNAGPIAKRLEGLPDAAKIAAALTDFEANLNDDEFFNTHWLDVILYRSFFGERVRVKVARAILENLIKAKSEQRPIFMFAHSLGTAVLHDTLHKLYLKDFSNEDQKEIGLDKHQVEPEENQIDGIFMIANVSRIVGGGKDPYQSIVKPGAGGICVQMVNVRHDLDPFTVPKQFNPPLDGSWVPKSDLDDDVYRLIKTNEIIDLNAHSLSQYMSNPAVYEDIFTSVFGRSFKPTIPEKNTANAEFKSKTVQGGFDKVKAAADAVDFKNIETIKQFVTEGEKFLEQIKKLKEDF